MITSSACDMRAILHILTKPGDSLADQVIADQQEQPDLRVNVVDLAASEPDYSNLLEEIFSADSIEVW